MDITVILEVIIVIIGFLASRYLIPFLKSQNSYRWLKYAIQAAEEQIGSGNGNKKFEFVKQFMLDKGFKYDDETLEIMIDGLVYELINQFKKEGRSK